jgi:hypothetical protein
MVTPDGLLLPILATIGNHDAGSNHGAGAFASVVYDGDDDPRLPPMLRFFPHEVPDRPPSARRTYHRHVTGGGGGRPAEEPGGGNTTMTMSILVLDTGYVATVDGPQRQWLASQLQRPHDGSEAAADSVHKFVAYHVPLYASTGRWQEDDNNAEDVAARQAWVPLFDAAGVAAAFEHHVHTLKRTRPMKGSQYDASGTTYLGDGQWGLSAIPASAEKAVLNRPGTGAAGAAQVNLATTQVARHIWEVAVGAGPGGRSTVAAIGEDGQTLDSAVV